ncbi:hypothetical protein AX15_004730 [Amanita polypyramis BW_CC]|nr:hypothetical protein AX15_004730 [Amanita polypyramis BW_CC]
MAVTVCGRLCEHEWEGEQAVHENGKKRKKPASTVSKPVSKRLKTASTRTKKREVDENYDAED